MAQTTDSTIKSSARAYVVFDKATGDILHVLHAVTISHGSPENALPVNEKPEARALRLAGVASGANVDVLSVESAQVNTLNPLKVDTASRTIVEKVVKS